MMKKEWESKEDGGNRSENYDIWIQLDKKRIIMKLAIKFFLIQPIV